MRISCLKGFLMSASQPFNKEFIQDLAKMLSDCDLTEIEIEHDKSKLRVVRNIQHPVYAPMQAPYPMSMPYHQGQQAPMPHNSHNSHNNDTQAPHTPENNAVIKGEQITSPMVGTVYLSSDPESAPFIKIGDTVEIGQTIMIVEAMKVMNNIPASKAGIVKAIKVSDKDPVEYGQLLVIIG
jgi:acetyl-CoA carboxylase biotin carboxyl carrier protein